MRPRRFYSVTQEGPAAVLTIQNPPRNFMTNEMVIDSLQRDITLNHAQKAPNLLYYCHLRQHYLLSDCCHQT